LDSIDDPQEKTMDDVTIRKSVREHYAAVARDEKGCCASPAVAATNCCGNTAYETVGKAIGYSEKELAAVPEGANMGLGCGNPLALSDLKEGETVVDLGSGGGFDCFLAARRVGVTGRVIGVDMTTDMIEKARGNAKKAGASNVEFRLGEIEHLPVADNSADMIISNCVINLSTDKPQVFREALRVLKPGGRLMVSDLVLLRPLPEKILASAAAYAGCISGAWLKEEYLAAMREAGFDGVTVLSESTYPIGSSNPDATELAILAGGFTAEEVRYAAESVVSVKVHARKST
jgi:ubiquinone/menaquinone biosynthesis C-methylase UbiE